MTFFSNRVRFDTDTGLGSALDVIRIVTGVKSNHAAAYIRIIVDRNADIRLESIKINGVGRPTPSADIETLEEIVRACPSLRNTPVDEGKRERFIAQMKRAKLGRGDVRKKRGRAIHAKRSTFGTLTPHIIVLNS